VSNIRSAYFTFYVLILLFYSSIPKLNASQISDTPSDVLMKGQPLIEKKLFGESRMLFLQALKKFPDHAELHLGYAISEMGLSHDKQAIEAFKLALNLDSTLTKAYTGLGLIYLRSMQFKKASDYLEQALKLNPDDIESHLWIAEAQMNNQHFQSSLQHYGIALSLMEERVQQFPDSTQLRQTLIDAYIKSGKWENALTEYEALKLLNPALAEVMYNQIIQARNSHDEQLAYLKQTFNSQKKRTIKASLAFKIGLAYLSVQDFEKAKFWLYESYKQDSQQPHTLNALAIVHLNLEQPQEAIKLLEAATENSPDNEMILLNLGHAYLKAEQYNKAITYFQKAIEANQNLANAYYGLAMAYYSLETNMKTLAIVHSKITYSTEFTEQPFSSISSLTTQKEKRFENIIQSLKKAVALRPDFYQAQFALGMAYIEIQLYAKAVEAFNMSIRFNPKNAEFFLGRGVAYKSLGYLETAKLNIKIAIGLEPGLAVAHEHLGGIYISENNFPEAIKSFLNAKTIAPKNVSTYVILTRLYLRTGQKILAQKTVEEIADLNPMLYKKLKRDLRL